MSVETSTEDAPGVGDLEAAPEVVPLRAAAGRHLGDRHRPLVRDRKPSANERRLRAESPSAWDGGVVAEDHHIAIRGHLTAGDHAAVPADTQAEAVRQASRHPQQVIDYRVDTVLEPLS